MGRGVWKRKEFVETDTAARVRVRSVVVREGVLGL